MLAELIDVVTASQKLITLHDNDEQSRLTDNRLISSLFKHQSSTEPGWSIGVHSTRLILGSQHYVLAMPTIYSSLTTIRLFLI